MKVNQLGSSDFVHALDRKYKKHLLNAKSFERSWVNSQSNNQIPKSDKDINITERSPLGVNDYFRYPLIPSNVFNESLESPKHERKQSKKEVKIDLPVHEDHKNSPSLFSGRSPTIRLVKLKSHLKDTSFLFGIEDGRLTRVLMERWKMTEFILAFFVCLSILMGVLEYELEFENEESDNKFQHMLCWINSIITVVLISLTFLRLRWIFLLKDARKKLFKRFYISSTLDFAYLVLEIIILLPHATPFTEDYKIENTTPHNQKYYYKLNEIFNLILLLRIYILARFSIIYSSYYGNRAHRACQFYSVTPSYWFSGKCMIKSHPYLIISLSLFIVILVFGQAIRICESPILRNVFSFEKIIEINGGMDLRIYQNSIWLICVTITTVGYGDFFPKTSLGRLVIIGISAFGMITTSLMVATFQNELGLSNLEKNVYNTLSRLKVKDYVKKKARKVIKYMVRFNKISKATKKIDYNVLFKVKKSLMNFRNSQRLYQAMTDETYSVAEDLAKYFIDVEEKIKDLAIYQEVIRAEIRNTSSEPPHKKIVNFEKENDNLEKLDHPLSLIKEYKEDSCENFLIDEINEKNK